MEPSNRTRPYYRATLDGVTIELRATAPLTPTHFKLMREYLDHQLESELTELTEHGYIAKL